MPWRRGGVIVNPKSVLECATKLVFLGEWLDLLERMVWSHEVAHLQILVAWLRLVVWRPQKRLIQSFLGFLNCQVQPRGLACTFDAGPYSSTRGKLGIPLWRSWSPLLFYRPWLQSRGLRLWQVSRPCVLSWDYTDLTRSCWGGGGRGLGWCFSSMGLTMVHLGEWEVF